MARIANILFPADYFDRKLPDEALRTEYVAASGDARLDVRVFDLELFEERGMVALSDPFLDPSLPLVYRGWMMKPEQYAVFHDTLGEKRLSPIVDPDAYAVFHMFPLAYERHDVLREHSPRLLSFAGARADASVVNDVFSRFMVKDYVKSVKDTAFPAFFETPINQERMDEVIGEFVRLRGGLFTDGIVCKEFVDLRLYGDTTNEWKAFFVNGRLLNVSRNSNQPAIAPAPPEGLVSSCAALGSPYYTVDFAELADGGWVVVETGDGQVSGLAAAQDPVIYYQVLADMLEKGA